MQIELQEYPAYHKSRVSWAESIPLGWETGWLGECSSMIQTGPFGSQLHADEYVSDGIPVVNPSNIQMGKIEPDWDVTVNEKKAGSLQRHLFQRGDIVFARRGEMGRCALVREEETGWLCGTGSLLVRLKQHRLLPEFATLLLSQAGVRDALTLESVGATMDNLNTRILEKIRIPVPPAEDQKLILAFLIREKEKIGRLSNTRNEQLKRLQEQRTAVIHHATTKGIKFNAAVESSRVDLLNEVPREWQRNKLRYIVRFKGGGTPSKSNSEYWDGTIPWVSPKDMKSLEINDAEDHITNEALADSASSLIAKGCVLIVVRSGILRRCIPVAINVVDVALNQDMKALQSKELSPQFLMYFILGNQEQLLTLWRKHGSTVESLEQSLIGDTAIFLPPKAEQKAIVEYIDEETKKIDVLITKYEKELELLAEYRSSLISHAVTGKIDVRGLVPAASLDQP